MQHHQLNSLRERGNQHVSNSKGNTQFYFEEDYIILTDPHTSLTSSSLCTNVLFLLFVSNQHVSNISRSDV